MKLIKKQIIKARREARNNLTGTSLSRDGELDRELDKAAAVDPIALEIAGGDGSDLDQEVIEEQLTSANTIS